MFLLRELVDDATLSYAELGEKVALSAPAAHERVKRLRRDTKNFAVHLS
ncbi:AsnC family transcriptional regulator [Pectobacterium polaris]